MPRAHRYFLPGHIWHITHRCHQREYLLQSEGGRRCWIRWLVEAQKRFGLCVLDYIVTSNHVHLLVKDIGNDSIPKAMQLIAGCCAQRHNRRNMRKGSFWEGRYHATAIDREEHLARCVIYIDLNMVRAGVVNDPCDWADSGYHDIQNTAKSSGIVDVNVMGSILGIRKNRDLKKAHRKWIEDALRSNTLKREEKWTKSIAVGSKSYVESVKNALGMRSRYRRVVASLSEYELRERRNSYDSYLPGPVR